LFPSCIYYTIGATKKALSVEGFTIQNKVRI
jgi:hypothetical protein